MGHIKAKLTNVTWERIDCQHNIFVLWHKINTYLIIHSEYVIDTHIEQQCKWQPRNLLAFIASITTLGLANKALKL